MQLLRQLFDIAGGGPETDAFKHLSATLTVLRSLTSAATITNPECSRAVSRLDHTCFLCHAQLLHIVIFCNY